jgi:hypothetical protein
VDDGLNLLLVCHAPADIDVIQTSFLFEVEAFGNGLEVYDLLAWMYIIYRGVLHTHSTSFVRSFVRSFVQPFFPRSLTSMRSGRNVPSVSM